MDRVALHALLDRQLALPSEYRDGLTSHLPMALHALAALGADAARLAAFFERYAARFESLPAPGTAPPVDDWRALRGRPDVFAALRATFERALEAEGEDAVLRRALPALLEGVAAAAFHGLIRTGHAVEAGHRGELAAALAYWAWRWQPLAPPPDEGLLPPLPFDDWAAQLAEAAAGWRQGAFLISDRMAAASASAPYRALAGRLAPADDLVARFVAWAVGGYAETRNFTLLHAVTALRALRVLAPWLGDALRSPVLAHALTAAYLAAQAVPAQALPPPRRRDWPSVIEAALRSDDDHVIKLVHACRDHAARDGEGRYLEAAARAVG